MSPVDYDAIVIGSGAGGSAAAYQLALGGLRVALLE
jgi:choline dehydrogenase-like flavoprotein